MKIILLLLFVCGGFCDWTNVTNAIDSYQNIQTMVLIVGNSSGTVFTYSKGNTTVDTYIPVASASKWITSLLINKLVEQGKMSYSDNPQKYIPWWTTSPSDPRSNVTLSTLLSFTSGFADLGCTGNNSFTMDECAQMIYNSSFYYNPGTTFYYGGDHLHIAGYMAVKATSSTSYNTLFNTVLKTPLGLAASAVFSSQPNPNPAGGLVIKVSDYAKILYSIFMDSTVSQSTTNLMEQDHTGNVTYAYLPSIGIGQKWHYGYGLWVECHQAKFDQTCIDLGIYSSPGLYGFYPWIDRKNNYYGIIGTYNPTNLIGVSPQLGQIIQPLIVDAMYGSTTSGTTTGDATTSSSGSTTGGSSTTGSDDTGMARSNVANVIYLIVLIICLLM